MSEGKDLPRGLEGLRKLAGDVNCHFWNCLFSGTESDWNVTAESEIRLRDTLDRLADEIESERHALTDAERRVLELWPRFDDGEPVMPGDEFTGFAWRRQTVKSVDVRDGFTLLRTKDNGCVKRHVGERVKRPDSWERIEKDAREFARDNQLPHDVDQMERDALDLVRRAKALAGVE